MLSIPMAESNENVDEMAKIWATQLQKQQVVFMPLDRTKICYFGERNDEILQIVFCFGD